MKTKIRIVHHIIQGRHVLTSPDVPKLHVVHKDLERARSAVRPTLETLYLMQNRIRKPT